MVSLNSAWAQSRTAGVAQADQFTYGNFVSHYESNFPEIMSDPQRIAELLTANATDWLRVSVVNVTAQTTVYLQVIRHFQNGSESSSEGFVNIVVGLGTMIYRVVGANLNLTDGAYVQHSQGNISKILNRSYENTSREVIYMNTTGHSNITWIGSPMMNGTSDDLTEYYWDRATGALVEYSDQTVVQSDNYTAIYSSSYMLIASNVWTVPEYAGLPIMAFALVSLAILFFATLRKIRSNLKAGTVSRFATCGNHD